MDSQVNVRLPGVLERLSRSFQGVLDPESNSEEAPTLVVIEDDTILQKLHTHIMSLLNAQTNEYSWAQNVGLVSFVQSILEPNTVSNSKNSATCAFALKVLGSLISKEENFNNLTENKVMVNFLVILPCIRNDPTLFSAALNFVEGLLNHKTGLYWLIKNGIWEKLVLPSLRSPSVFVQRQGVNIISAILLLVIDTEHFESKIRDLILISDKFCELRPQLSQALSEEIRQSNVCVLQVLKEVLFKTLGKTTIYSQLRNISDISSRLVAMMKYQIPNSIVVHLSDILILNSLHRFQEKLIGFGIFEQFLLDSLCADMISLTRLLIESDRVDAFLKSSVNTHKYWMLFIKNLKETTKIDLSSVESVVFVLTGFQMTPVMVLYQTCYVEMMKKCPEKNKVISKWNEEIHKKIHIKEDHKVEAAKLEKLLVMKLEKDCKQSVDMAVVCITSLKNATEHLCPTCAVTVFQGLVFLLLSHQYTSSPMRYHTSLQIAVVDCLRVLVEKFNIDWRKCYVSVCLMGLLIDLLKVPGIKTQVKVCTLKAMKSCVNGFIPPVMSMLVNSEKLETNSIEVMGQDLNIYLSDLEWDVRDSALELLMLCMQLSREKYPYFVDWMLRYKLHHTVLTSLGDVEAYVRASALTVLAIIISIDKVWQETESENLAHQTLVMVLREGESPVRRAAMSLLQALFLAGKYSEEAVSKLVIPVVQKSTEDADDEVRVAALQFIRAHIQWMLDKSGMVDGEFPSVTFSSGKIIKLDEKEIRSRVLKVISWFCECGYLCSLLTCLKDPVLTVIMKADAVVSLLNDLITRYQIRIESTGRSPYGGSSFSSRNPSEETKVKEAISTDDTVKVADQVTKPNNISGADEIDRSINEILKLSTLANVTMIKRPYNEETDGFAIDVRGLVLTSKDVPQPKPSIPVAALLQSIEELSRSKVQDEDAARLDELLSLLDDIMLGENEAQSHMDDQRLRDCY